MPRAESPRARCCDTPAPPASAALAAVPAAAPYTRAKSSCRSRRVRGRGGGSGSSRRAERRGPRWLASTVSAGASSTEPWAQLGRLPPPSVDDRVRARPGPDITSCVSWDMPSSSDTSRSSAEGAPHRGGGDAAVRGALRAPCGGFPLGSGGVPPLAAAAIVVGRRLLGLASGSKKPSREVWTSAFHGGCAGSGGGRGRDDRGASGWGLRGLRYAGRAAAADSGRECALLAKLVFSAATPLPPPGPPGLGARGARTAARAEVAARVASSTTSRRMMRCSVAGAGVGWYAAGGGAGVAATGGRAVA